MDLLSFILFNLNTFFIGYGFRRKIYSKEKIYTHHNKRSQRPSKLSLSSVRNTFSTEDPLKESKEHTIYAQELHQYLPTKPLVKLSSNMAHIADAENSKTYETKRIDGKQISVAIKEEVANGVKELKESKDVVPGLGTILVGQRQDSALYVRMKNKAADKVGFYHVNITLEDTISEDELMEEVNKLNNDDRIHGILVQLPLPKHTQAGEDFLVEILSGLQVGVSLF